MSNELEHDAHRIECDELVASKAELTAAIDQERRQALQSAYQIGQAIDRAYHHWKLAAPVIDDEDLEDQFIAQLIKALMEPEDWLLSQWRLAQAFTEQQFQRLCDTPGITIFSIEPLLEVDPEVRSQLLERIVAEGLNGRKVKAAIQQLGLSV